MSQTIIEIIYYVEVIIILLSPVFTWWAFSYDKVLKNIFIKKHIIPFYDALESECGAKYPVVMETPYSDVFPEFLFNKNKDLTFYFFVKDKSFVIVRETDPDFYIEIPFSDVLCQECSEDKYSKNYDILLHFTHSSKIAELTFCTLTYDHKLDDRYGNRLTGDELCLFIRNTFMHKSEYESSHNIWL